MCLTISSISRVLKTYKGEGVLKEYSSEYLERFPRPFLPIRLKSCLEYYSGDFKSVVIVK